MVASGIVEEIRRRPGNLRYEYFFSMEDPETLLLIDAWESQEALDAYHASPLMGRIAELREKYDLHMTAVRFVQASARDEKYIRKYLKRG